MLLEGGEKAESPILSDENTGCPAQGARILVERD